MYAAVMEPPWASFVVALWQRAGTHLDGGTWCNARRRLRMDEHRKGFKHGGWGVLLREARAAWEAYLQQRGP